MAHDKIKVDEPLISTDVDSLIRAIAERKKVPLNDLRKLCKIDKKTMDKWIAVLEDEGYITVEYGLRGTYILWRDIEDVPEAVKNHRIEGAKSQIENGSDIPESDSSESDTEKPPYVKQDEAEDRTSEEHSEETNQEFTTETPLEEEPGPEELLSEYLARRKGGGEDIDSIKSSILSSLKGMEKNHDSDSKETGSEADSGSAGGDSRDAPDDADPAEMQTEAVYSEEDTADDGKKPDEMMETGEEKGNADSSSIFRKETLKPTSKARAPSADVRELMSTYLDEINREKANIESLKKERVVLYREKFASTEGKMEADIVVLTEKIIEKESKIEELKERVLELPDKVEELGRLQEQMDALKKEGREALQRTRAKVGGFLVGIGESKTEVEEKIAKASSVLDSQEIRLKELEKLCGTLDSRSGKLKGALDDAKVQLEEIDGVMSSLASDLQKVDVMKVEVVNLTESIKQTVALHGEELSSLEQELEGIERTEHWVEEYIRDYEQKIEDIEQYVSKSDDELATLKEASEALYMKKYLGELENMTEEYSGELGDAVSREKEIEEKIAGSRARITELVTESQEMIKKLRNDVPETSEKDFGIMAAKVKARTARAKNIVEEKRQERAKLADDSRRTRKTERHAAVKIRARKRPPKGPSKKKRK